MGFRNKLTSHCSETKDAWLALGNEGFNRVKTEEGSKVFRRSIYFVKDLSAGHVVKSSDIRRIRPGNGLAPKCFNEIIGKKLLQDVKTGTPTTWRLINEN